MNVILLILTLGLTQSITSEQEYAIAQKLVFEINQAVDPMNPTNAYFPALMKEKMLWIQEQYRAGVLEIHISNGFQNQSLDLVMTSEIMPSGRKMIYVSAPAIAKLSREMPRKNLEMFYALILTHEAIHFDPEGAGGRRNVPSTVIRKEEVRAWHKWLLGAVRPLRSKGYKIPKAIAKVDDVLRQCGDKITCPVFVRLISDASSAK